MIAMIGGLFVLVLVMAYLAVIVLMIAGLWTVLAKAGQPGWAAIIPILNLYFLIKAAGKPGWWLILMLIPLVNIVICIMVMLALAQCFGKGGGFALGLIFLPFIFYPVLGFGSAQYTPPAATA